MNIEKNLKKTNNDNEQQRSYNPENDSRSEKYRRRNTIQWYISNKMGRLMKRWWTIFYLSMA
jgi:hypothetical protein